VYGVYGVGVGVEGVYCVGVCAGVYGVGVCVGV
jgi:hypothetical protein